MTACEESGRLADRLAQLHSWAPRATLFLAIVSGTRLRCSLGFLGCGWSFDPATAPAASCRDFSRSCGPSKNWT